MQREINLVPENLVKRKEKSAILALSSKVLGVLVAVALLFALASFYLYFKLNSSLAKLNLDLDQKKESVKSLEKIEQQNNELSFKLEILNKIIADQEYYSGFLEEVKKVLPPAVVIDDINFTDNASVTVSGTALSYGSLADFIENVSSASEDPNSIYKEISLSEVTLKKETRQISFSSMIKLKDNALKAKTKI
ncbi:PilN domain-containing protein [Candidatus Parcubacteria bacterium]|nr:PilN domain-containing protein [Patescibacteria group bacterium]MBU4380911.1 PilN domain-containing protein [Patescibacteria group bacterium]MCG2688961.1 PilN domain-containing protein [Candidatus Parcubacteria bacterium]